MRLIVGVDGTREGMQALEETVERAREGDDITVAIFSDESESLAAVEATVRDRLDELGIPSNVEVIEGDPGGKLVELADVEGYDQIVIPGCRDSPLGKIKLDSTIEFVLLNARTSVTLVR